MNSFKVFIDHELKLVRVTAIGEILLADGKEIISVGRGTAMEHEYNVFYDISKATTTVPFSSWYHLPRELPVFKDKDARHVKAAVFASPLDKAVDGYKFYENVTANLGFNLRIFFDEKEALEWLQL